MSLILDTHRCTACGACVDVCEAAALSLPEMEASSPRPFRKKLLNAFLVGAHG